MKRYEELTDLLDQFRENIKDASQPGDIKRPLLELRTRVAERSAEYKQRFYEGLKDLNSGVGIQQSADPGYLLGFEAANLAYKRLR